MAQLLPPSAFEIPEITAEDSKKLLLDTFEEIDRRVLEELQRKIKTMNGVDGTPQQEPRVFESAIKNQASLIEQLNNKLASYEEQFAFLRTQLNQKDNDLELMAQQCEQSLATLNEEHTRSITKIEIELDYCREQLEKEVTLRLENEQRLLELEDKNKLKLGNLQASLDDKISELKEAREESTKLRLYFTGGRDLVSGIFDVQPPPVTNLKNAPSNCSDTETITNLRVQIDALQHIIDVQEEQLRTSKPDLIPGLTTLEKWRRKVYEMMVRTKLNELSVAKELNNMRQEVTATKDRLQVAEAKLTAKEVELKELKSRSETGQKLVAVSSNNEAKLRECVDKMVHGLAALGARFNETVSRSMLQVATMERRLELASKRIRQIGAAQRSVCQLELLLAERNSEKVACEMQIVIANETIEELRRQLSFCQQQLSSASRQKANALEVMENDRAYERDASTAQIRSLASELQELRVEHAKLMAAHGSLQRQLEGTEEQAKIMTENLTARLKEVQLDYDALAKIAREHGVMERVTARRLSGTPPTATNVVRAEVESLYKSLIR